MAAKQRRHSLTIQEQKVIVERLEAGEQNVALAEEFKVCPSTISRIKNRAGKIKEFAKNVQEQRVSSRKRARASRNVAVDDALYTWFSQKRSQGQPISGPMLCAKVQYFNERLGGSTNFKASSGWLRNFKARHGIRQLSIHGEAMSADTQGAEDFIQKFKTEVMDEDWDEDLVYNADETGLNWKALPRKTLAGGKESRAVGHKMRKDRLTILVCSNVSGTHKLPLLVVGKYKSPRAIKFINNLPVKYMSQKKGWMDRTLFTEWYDTIFVPAVKRHQEMLGKEGKKVILLLDNAPSHPSEKLLERENGKYVAKFLPYNVTSLIQPMDQGVIQNFKTIYRRNLLGNILLNDGSPSEENINFFTAFYKRFNLRDCIYLAADAWEEIPAFTLKRAWKKIIGERPEDLPPEKTPTNQTILEMVNKVPGSPIYSLQDVEEWLQIDTYDLGYEILTDEKLIKQYGDDDKENSTHEDEEEDEAICIEPEELQNQNPQEFTAEKAVEAIEYLLGWVNQESSTNDTDVVVLQHLLNKAKNKTKK